MKKNKLSVLSDEILLSNTQQLVREEREILANVLRHLEEVASRRLYLKRGYSSLFDFCVNGLRYSESAAQRRIDAMRAIKELPEVEEKIAAGKLSLSTVATVQSFIRQENKKRRTELKCDGTNVAATVTAAAAVKTEEKREIFCRIEGKTRKETEKILCTQFPQAIPHDKIRELTEDKTEIRFVASKDLVVKLQRVRELLSHKNAHPSFDELLILMADIVIAKKDPLRGVKPLAPKPRARKTTTKTPPQTRSRYIPASVKRLVWGRAKGRCQYRDPETGAFCGSQYRIQIDHRIAFALGGSNQSDNLQLLCQAHNLAKAGGEFESKGAELTMMPKLDGAEELRC